MYLECCSFVFEWSGKLFSGKLKVCSNLTIPIPPTENSLKLQINPNKQKSLQSIVGSIRKNLSSAILDCVVPAGLFEHVSNRPLLYPSGEARSTFIKFSLSNALFLNQRSQILGHRFLVTGEVTIFNLCHIV